MCSSYLLSYSSVDRDSSPPLPYARPQQSQPADTMVYFYCLGHPLLLWPWQSVIGLFSKFPYYTQASKRGRSIFLFIVQSLLMKNFQIYMCCQAVTMHYLICFSQGCCWWDATAVSIFTVKEAAAGSGQVSAQHHTLSRWKSENLEPGWEIQMLVVLRTRQPSASSKLLCFLQFRGKDGGFCV